MKKIYQQLLFSFTCITLGAGYSFSQCTTPAAPSISGATLAPCVTSSDFTLTASGSSALGTGWYTNSWGGNAVNQGSVFVTPTLTSGATYYVGQTASVSTGSVGLPPYASTYLGNTRGMWFTAPTSFIITGVRVPTDISSGNSSIAIMKFPTAPPAFSAFTNTFNLLYFVQNVPGTTIIPVYIPVYNGDIIGVLGCRVSGTSNGTSYGSSGPYSSTIGSFPITINRLGMQYPLATTSPLELWTEVGSIGRVELYTTIGCLSTLTPVSVSVTPAPQINVSGPPSSICSGASATLSASGVNSYTWANNSSNSSSIVVSPGSTTTYTVSGSISPTCGSTSTISVVVNSGAPSLTVAASSNSVCLGGTVSLTGSGANTYSWTSNVTNSVAFSPTATASYTLTGANACGVSSSVTTVSVSPLAISATSSSSVICAGSPATLIPGGATSYTWMPGNVAVTNYIISPTSSGVYTVTGKQGNCLGTNTVSIATNPLPTVSVSANFTSVCVGDPVVLTASGGISYTWSPGNLSGPTITVNPTAPSSYSVGMTNSFGCSSGSTQVVVTMSTPVIVTSANFNIVCPGDPVDISASGANQYLWSTGAATASLTVNPTSTTIYSVTGSIANCSSTQTLEIDVFTPTISIVGTTAVCLGNTATLQASGAASYSWSTGSTFSGMSDTPTITTTYTLSTISTSLGVNCPSTSTAQVIVNPTPNVSVAVTRSIICRGESVSFSASGASTYSWSDGSTGASLSFTPNTITILSYSATGTNAQGCKASAGKQVVVNGCNGLPESFENTGAVNVYPNPSYGSLTISYHQPVELTILNSLGQKTGTVSLTEVNHFEASISGLSRGVYYLVGNNKGSSLRAKIVVD